MPVVRRDLDYISDTPPFDGDDRAQQELSKIYNETRWSDSAKDMLHFVFLLFIIVASLNAIGVVAIRIAHLALPVSCQWLTTGQIQSIDKLFFSGAIGGFIVNHLRKVQRG